MNWKLIISSLFLVLNMAVQAQTNAIQNAQAITEGAEYFYNTEGYDIFQKDFQLPFDEKGFKKLKQKLNLPKETPILDSPDFPEFPNLKIMEHTVTSGSVVVRSVYFISTPKWEMTKVVWFVTYCSRVPAIEKEFYTAIRRKTLPKSIFTPMKIDTVLFAGRPIDLGPPCSWMGVRNVQCPNYGQMNWSEFSDSTRAQEMIISQRTENMDSEKYDLLEQKVVPVLFEGQEAKALKCTLKIKIPELIMGGSNILVVYYVTAPVRGRYVACVMSHFTDDIHVNNERLPQLLARVMELK